MAPKKPSYPSIIQAYVVNSVQKHHQHGTSKGSADDEDLEKEWDDLLRRLLAYTHKKFGRGCLYGISADDLVQVAVLKFLSSERVYNSKAYDEGIFDFFTSVIDSLIFHLWKKKRVDQEAYDRFIDDVAAEVASISQEENLVSKIDTDQILKLIKQEKPDLAPIFSCLFERRIHKNRKIAEFLNIDEHEIKLMRRRLVSYLKTLPSRAP